MPRVPTYQGDRVRTGPLRMPRQGAVPTPATYGAQFGETLGQTALVVEKIREEQQQRADDLTLTTAEQQFNQLYQVGLLSEDRGPQGTKGLATMQGIEPQNALEGNVEEWDLQAEEILKSAKTPEQRLRLEHLRNQQRARYVESATRHASSEYAKYETGRTHAVLRSSQQTAMAAATTEGGLEVVAEQLARQRDLVQQRGHTIGLLSQEAKDEHLFGLHSTTHLGVIQQLVAAERYGEAGAYFARTKDAIAADTHDDVQRLLEAGTLRRQAQAETARILASGGTLSEQRAQAKQITDPTLQDEVVQRLEHEATVQDRVTREHDEQRMRAAYDVLDQTGNTTNIPLQEWQRFDGPTRSAMQSYADRKAQGVPVTTNWPTYYRLMGQAKNQPEAFATVNLLTSRHLLDDGDFRRLVDLQGGIKEGKREQVEPQLADFQTKEQIVNSTLTQYGIDPNAKYNTPEGQAVAQLRRMLDIRVSALQAGGQKVRNPDIQTELDHLLGATVEVPGSWWGLVPGLEATVYPQQKRLLDLTVADIAPDERKAIEAALRAKGRPVTDPTVLDLYLETQIRAQTRRMPTPAPSH